VCYQVYGRNLLAFEWIQAGQPYFKFKVAKQGIYRIDAGTLASVGIDLEGTQPKRFQLFRDGQEQAVFIYGDKDGTFDVSDYIEFYADINDGKLDTELYRSAADQAHTLYSLYTDTAYYFVTILPLNSSKGRSKVNRIEGYCLSVSIRLSPILALVKTSSLKIFIIEEALSLPIQTHIT
jgi:hypothetical protein